MSLKRKVTFAKDDEVESRRSRRMQEVDAEGDVPVPVRVQDIVKGKHSLDSDEEDVKEDDDVLKLDDIEGQEESKVDIEDGIRFTPFNLREEYEEGEFDANGMYIFKKDKNRIKDNWIDDIDWAKVKQSEKRQRNNDELVSDDLLETVDVIPLYQTMLKLMQPGESVAKAIKRLGGTKSGTSAVPPRRNKQLWKTKKTISSDSTITDTPTTSGAEVPSTEKPKTPVNEDLMSLIGCADKLLTHNGDMEIYQDTYEKLSYKVKSASEASSKAEPVDSGLDMFADELPSTSTHQEPTPHNDADTKIVNQGTVSSVTEVMWEYKWENVDGADIHGPFSSLEMLQWTQDNYFPKGVFVRKTSAAPDGLFYSSQRIDFDLYV